MRIHSRILTRDDLFNAVRNMPRVFVVTADRKGSRSHGTAWEVALTGTSPRNSAFGNRGYRAATWDEWGVFLSELYRIDPQAMVGSAKNPTYGNAEHFHWATTDRYRDGMPSDTHAQHKWEWIGWSAGNAYSVLQCCKCSAQGRRTLRRTWWDLSGDTIADYRADVLIDASV